MHLKTGVYHYRKYRYKELGFCIYEQHLFYVVCTEVLLLLI